MTIHPTPLLICTVRYSDNLGDGVIGDCLEHVVHRIDPAIQVSHVDMAGREGFGHGNGSQPLLFKMIFYVLPAFLRPLVTLAAWPVLMRPKLVRALNRAMPAKPFNLVFGGGQILSDVALNFPLKFNFVAKWAARHGARIAVSAAGAAPHWSFIGRRMFGSALSHPAMVAIGLRDAASVKNLLRNLPKLPVAPTQTIDPGIFAADVYGQAFKPAKKGTPARIGLGIAHPAELATQAENPADFNEEPAFVFWTAIAEQVSAAGHTPVLFTNGAAEDEAFLTRLAQRLPKLEVMPRPTTPHDLVANIASLQGMVGHRLHANIVAFSLGVPTVALVWDGKVRAFAELAGRAAWCLNSSQATSTAVAERLNDALHHGVDADHRAKLQATIINDASMMLAKLGY